ncbi:MAG: EAL domain-containing protein [Ruminococcus sp.]|jgi:diguanylate cyclase (GGDEF)-like protein|nr:EAL domain-containing protein [Ruminococcus sp.]
MSKKQRSSAGKLQRQETLILFFSCLILLLAFFTYAFIVTRFNTTSTVNTRINTIGTLASGLVGDYMTEKDNELTRFAADTKTAEFILGVKKQTDWNTLAAEYPEVIETMDEIPYTDTDIIGAWILEYDSGVVYDSSGNILVDSSADIKNQRWFKRATEGGYDITVTAVYQSNINRNFECYSLAKPIKSNGHTIGYVGMDIHPESLRRLLRNYVQEPGAYPLLANQEGSIIYIPGDPAFSEKFDPERMPVQGLVYRSGTYAQGEGTASDDDGGSLHYYLDSVTIPNWNIIVVFDEMMLGGDMMQAFLFQAAFLTALMLLFFVIMSSVMRQKVSLVKPLSKMIESVKSGDMSYRIDTNSKSELADIARGFNEVVKETGELRTKLDKASRTDIVTGLLNRLAMYEKIDEMTAQKEGKFAVVYTDLDNFRWLNETFGHRFGDEALAVFAKTISDCIPVDSDGKKLAFPFRYSGDELIIIVPYEDTEDILAIQARVRSAFAQPVPVDTQKIYFRFSAGIALYPEDGTKPDELMRLSDTAMHLAKDNGKNTAVFSPKDIPGGVPRKAYIAQALTSALQSREMYLNFQPIVSFESCDIYGFEALLRWNSTEFGNIGPSDFINVAEESGEIIQIGKWIFENACRFIGMINDKFEREFMLSVNVAPSQLKQSGYLKHIKNVLDISQLNPSKIQIELTESTLIDFIDNHSEIIDEVSKLGITIALDDFGTGYSSMKYLRDLPVKCLKIDKTFIDTVNDRKGESITDSIIDLVHNLGIVTVAEGIETVEQYDKLAEMKCDYIQGYIISKPLDENESMRFVENYDAKHRPTKEILIANAQKLQDEKNEA